MSADELAALRVQVDELKRAMSRDAAFYAAESLRFNDELTKLLRVADAARDVASFERNLAWARSKLANRLLDLDGGK